MALGGAMAGRYQGYHWFPNKTESVEVFWRSDGWCWWRRVPGHPPKGEAVGPFLTSTEAYRNANAGQSESTVQLRS
jgi:hypothetical protein